MPFRVVPKDITDRIQQVYNSPSSSPTTPNEKALAAAYLELAARFNEHILYMTEFFKHTSFEGTFDSEETTRRIMSGNFKPSK